VQISTPPSPLASSQPLLASTLLELAHDRALNASSTLLPPSTQSSVDEALESPPPLSEKSALTLAIADALPSLRVDDLEEWLPLTTRLINTIPDPAMRSLCVERFWDVLSHGEMDVERANFCVIWWSTRGGRELLLFGEQLSPEQPLMTGGVGGAAPESKL
jgi:hypothetical protein